MTQEFSIVTSPVEPGQNTSEAEVASPCIRQCCLNADDVCVGCKRTMSEIMEWSQADPLRKRQILNNCQSRRQ